MTDEGDVYMLDDKSSTEPLTDSGQYTLRDIFFLTTLTAILVFLAMPLGGLVSRAAIIFWITLALVEFSAVVTIFRYLSKRRQNLLAITGAKWGNGFVVEWTWSGWPHLKAWLYLLGLAGYALLQNALVTWMLNSQLTQKVPLPVSFLPMLSQLWIMPLFLFLLARALCQVAWRVYPDTVEFYARGV